MGRPEYERESLGRGPWAGHRSGAVGSGAVGSGAVGDGTAEGTQGANGREPGVAREAPRQEPVEEGADQLGLPRLSDQETALRAGRARRRHRRLLTGLLVVLVVLVAAGTIGSVHVDHEINPVGGPGPVVTVRIPAGSSTMRIAHLLAAAGVIHGPDVFAVYVKFEGAGPLLAGTYRLATNEPYSEVILLLENGPVPIVRKLVVPEGFTVRQIAAAVGHLHGIGISAAAFMAAARSGQSGSPYAPAGSKSLEGFLFPATYPVRQGESAGALVQYMVSTFDYQASQLGLAAAASKLHYNPYQVIIVASIVEREAKFDQDRGRIASVIYNRLALGMPIGAESTLLYGLGDPTGQVDITTPSRYNTLLNKGLPPTPISNPGIPSMEAAMNPPHTTYLYWVEVNPDGKMGYATTQAQFKQLQRECRAARLC